MQEIPINKIKTNSGQIPDVPANPRTITKDKFELLKKSITEDTEFLKLNPILLYDMADGTYVALGGNQRVRACKSLGMKTIHATIVANGTDPQLVKSRIIKHNAGYGDDDWDALGNEWSDEPLTDWGLDLPEDWLEQEPEIEEDEAPEVSDEPPVSKLGEVYQLGRHRVMCADSTVKENVEKLMNGDKADMVFTDPPYGYKYESNYQKQHDMLMNDDQFLDFIPALYGSLNDDCAVYTCGSFQTISFWIEYIKGLDLDFKNIIVWKKNNWSMGDLKGAYAGQHELIIYSVKGRVELRNGRDRDVWEFDREPPTLHPTMKPIELVSRAIKNTSDSGSIVLDSFLGSGSTLIACEQTGRTCFGMELDEKYVDVVRKRYHKFVTGSEEGWADATPAV